MAILPARLPRPRPDQPITREASRRPKRRLPTGRFGSGFLRQVRGIVFRVGRGQTQRERESQPGQCTLTGQPSASGISISGKCGASIFSREVRADIRYDPASGVYTGTYVGSSIGPARLRGRRRGDAVVMTITWPKPVNGDTKATMTIHNSGNGRLAITVSDEVQAGGPRPKSPGWRSVAFDRRRRRNTTCPAAQ